MERSGQREEGASECKGRRVWIRSPSQKWLSYHLHCQDQLWKLNCLLPSCLPSATHFPRLLVPSPALSPSLKDLLGQTKRLRCRRHARQRVEQAETPHS